MCGSVEAFCCLHLPRLIVEALRRCTSIDCLLFLYGHLARCTIINIKIIRPLRAHRRAFYLCALFCAPRGDERLFWGGQTGQKQHRLVFGWWCFIFPVLVCVWRRCERGFLFGARLQTVYECYEFNRFRILWNKRRKCLFLIEIFEKLAQEANFFIYFGKKLQIF